MQHSSHNNKAPLNLGTYTAKMYIFEKRKHFFYWDLNKYSITGLRQTPITTLTWQSNRLFKKTQRRRTVTAYFDFMTKNLYTKEAAQLNCKELLSWVLLRAKTESAVMLDTVIIKCFIFQGTITSISGQPAVLHKYSGPITVFFETEIAYYTKTTDLVDPGAITYKGFGCEGLSEGETDEDSTTTDDAQDQTCQTSEKLILSNSDDACTDAEEAIYTATENTDTIDETASTAESFTEDEVTDDSSAELSEEHTTEISTTEQEVRTYKKLIFSSDELYGVETVSGQTTASGSEHFSTSDLSKNSYTSSIDTSDSESVSDFTCVQKTAEPAMDTEEALDDLIETHDVY